jgi:16S rRNA (guanine966-N2)-methyltransferase
MTRASASSNTLRIIGGQWRSRKLRFPDVDGLRPTPDRVRETLFNWLRGVIEGARCLDLFAGSGALSFEALSRGAGAVVMVERDAGAVRALRTNLELLNAGNAQLIQRDALEFLRDGPGTLPPFDIVFLDPPYHRNLIDPCCALLHDGGWLAPAARIYIEAEASLGGFRLPPDFELMRSKRAGQVGYHLAASVRMDTPPP